jgi:cell division transport system permease protein
MALNANYVARETAANLTRNITLTVASILTVFVSLAIVGTAVLVRQGAQNMTREFEGGVEFIVYLEPGIEAEQLAQVEQLLDDNPAVRRATYVDEDATYTDFRRLFRGQTAMLENVRKQDLPTSFRVEPTDASVQVVTELVNYYRRQDNVYEVRAATDVIREMKGMTTFINNGLFVFVAFLLLASALLILNTIRTAMFARRREIEVMKLVGATNWFIRVPFMLEGLVQGLVLLDQPRRRHPRVPLGGPHCGGVERLQLGRGHPPLPRRVGRGDGRSLLVGPRAVATVSRRG